MDGRIKKMMPGVWIGTGEGERKRKRKRKKIEEKREGGEREEKEKGSRLPTGNLSPLICINGPN